MIPYFQWFNISLGPLTIQVWGLMVALGMMVALWISVKMAPQWKLEKQHILDVAFWIILGSILGSRVAYVLSEWALFSENIFSIFKIWEGGLSISGGFAGSVAAFALYVWRKNIPVLPYADIIVFGLPVGLWIGRLGCFFIYDHPGKPTSFFLGQAYVDGVVRHNNGLYLSLNGLIIAVIFFILWKRNPQRTPGWYSAFFLVWYGIVRFLLDFLRATHELNIVDARFFGLTMAQYFAVAMIAGGVYLWYSIVYAREKKTPKGR